MPTLCISKNTRLFLLTMFMFELLAKHLGRRTIFLWSEHPYYLLLRFFGMSFFMAVSGLDAHLNIVITHRLKYSPVSMSLILCHRTTWTFLSWCKIAKSRTPQSWSVFVSQFLEIPGGQRHNGRRGWGCIGSVIFLSFQYQSKENSGLSVCVSIWT